MGRLTRLLGAAVDKMDAWGDAQHQKDLAKLTPAERERYEAFEAQAEAARVALEGGAKVDRMGRIEGLPDPRLTGRALRGPAGETLAGISKRPKVDAIEDAAAWDARMREERAVRDAARAPYLAPDRHPVRITRVATRGKTQIREIADHLATSGLAGRPDLLYGAARVPDLISPSRMGGEKGGVVEWDLVHAAPAEGLPPAAPPATLRLDAHEGWVARRVGERAPLDEDVALAVLRRAGLGPDATLAVARDVAFEKESTGGGDDGSTSTEIYARVKGVHVLVPAEHGDALAGSANAARPWTDVPVGAPEGMVVEVLQWDVIAKALQPRRQHRPLMPSPFPYLPVTPQELLRSYLEIVGLDPADTCSAQVTHDHPYGLMGRTSDRSFLTVQRTGGGPDLPCADGKPRKRMSAGHHVVVTYRDRPAYADGRARFDAYMDEQLQADLRRGTAIREPVPKPIGKLMKTVERIGDVVDFFTMEPSADLSDPWARYVAVMR